jgi:hypothetical protein
LDLRKNFVLIATLSIMALFLISSPITVRADSYNAASSKQVSLDIPQGWITDAGPQHWTMSGGVLGLASDTATPVLSAVTWNSVNYNLSADVKGLSTKGSFTLHLQGTTADGRTINLRVHTTINSSIPAVCFPSYSVTGVCLAGDTSEIPAYFVANGHLRVQLGSNVSPKYNVTLLVEDAALNPFGAPIVITSMDGSLLVVATYDHAKTVWDGVQTAGIVTGMMGKSSVVSGTFTQKIATDENYVTGTATDKGQIALVGMTPSSLNSHGRFQGTSTIPTTGSMDCSPVGLPGTCLETGFLSVGSFAMADPKGSVLQGTYNVQWPTPSILFGGNMTGTFG